MEVITELLDGTLAAVYLYGSAIMGGLRRDSDVDILAVTCQSLSDATRKALYNKPPTVCRDR